MQNPGRKCRDLTQCIRLATAGCASVLEYGCGFGNRLVLVEAGSKVGVEVHEPYIEEARRRYPWMTFECANAMSHVEGMMMDGKKVDAVLLVDFVEHLTEFEANWFLKTCKAIARKIVLWIPIGNHPQCTDAYNMGGDHWQIHRSTWQAVDLEALGFDVKVWHTHASNPDLTPLAAFCIWNKAEVIIA